MISLKQTEHLRDLKRGTFVCKEVSLEPSRALGYFCGLTLGDGSLFKTKMRNYGVKLETTDVELADCFHTSVKVAFPNLKPFYQTRRKIRYFPQCRKKYDSQTVTVTVYSKRLYEALRSSKGKDFHWTIPTFLTSVESKIGFLQGIFDAEGSIHSPHGRKRKLPSVALYSKHEDNLLQVKTMLSHFGVRSCKVYRIRHQCAHAFELRSTDTVTKFKPLIGFNLPRKRSKLASFCGSKEFEEVK